MATPVSDSIPLTGISFIDGLVQGSSWQFPGSPVLTYSLHNYGGSWNSTRTKAVLKVIDAWSAVVDIELTRLNFSLNMFPENTTADMAISATGHLLQDFFGAVGLAIFPDPDFVDDELGISRSEYPRPEGDIYVDSAFNKFKPGGFDYQTILHEFGHALGLKHPHDDGANGRPTFSMLGISSYDDGLWTVMSYNHPTGNSFPKNGWQATPMPLDILAIQHIYGPNITYHTGDDVYVLGNKAVVQTIWDAGGIDTIDASKIRSSVDIDLTPGEFIFHGKAVTAIAFDVIIENVTGSKRGDVLIGNDADNLIFGHKGSDVLIGKSGDDQLDGGKGNDILVFDQENIMVDGGKGIDTLRFDTSGEILDLTGLTGEGGIYRSLEIIDLTGTGNNSLILNIADVSALPEKINLFIKDGRKQLLILGDAGDEVTSTGQDWIIGADQMVYGTLVTPYTHAVIMAELFVDTDITQIIS